MKTRLVQYVSDIVRKVFVMPLIASRLRENIVNVTAGEVICVPRGESGRRGML